MKNTDISDKVKRCIRFDKVEIKYPKQSWDHPVRWFSLLNVIVSLLAISLKNTTIAQIQATVKVIKTFVRIGPMIESFACSKIFLIKKLDQGSKTFRLRMNEVKSVINHQIDQRDSL